MSDTEDHSFDVSHISHVSSSDDDEDVYSSHLHRHQPAHPHPSTALNSVGGGSSKAWLSSPITSSYDAFVAMQQRELEEDDSPRKRRDLATARPPVTSATSGPSYHSSSLSEEREKLRQRRSAQFQDQHQDHLTTHTNPAAAAVVAAPSSESQPESPPSIAIETSEPSSPSHHSSAVPPQSIPRIPRLQFSNIDQSIPSTSTAAPASNLSTSISSSRPTTSGGNGSQTTRTRLSQFNAKLRAARRIQQWFRTLVACRPAKAELAQRKAELVALSERAMGFRPGATTEKLALPLEDISPTAAASIPATARDKKKDLAQLKNKIASRPCTAHNPVARTASISPTRSRLMQATSASTSRNASSVQPPTLSSPTRAARSLSTQRSTSNAGSTINSPTSKPPRQPPVDPSTFRPFPLSAQPALRALLQGFLVRHVWSHKSTQELIMKIKDVKEQIENARAERTKLATGLGGGIGGTQTEEVRQATYFIKTLQKQLVGLQDQLNLIFSPEVRSAALSAPSRVRFEKRLSLAGNDSNVGDSIARPTTAGTMLKRKSQRRFLKSRPSTAGAGHAAPASNISGEDGGMSGDEMKEQISDSNAGGSEGPSGSQTSRTYLKRKSQKQPSHKLDWSRVNSKVDAKLDGYQRAPILGSAAPPPGIVYDSVTGKEWSADQPAASPPPTHPPSRRPATAAASSGSQTARTSTVPPDPVRKIFKPSGHSNALPLTANTDSAAPPIEPLTERGRNRKSRHIILEPKKLDLSKVTSRVDYRSPYKSTEYNQDSDDDYEYASELNHDFDKPKRKQPVKKAANPYNLNDPDLSVYPPTRPATARVSSNKSNSNPLLSDGSSLPSHLLFPTYFRRVNHGGVTPSRDELKKLDEDITRARAEAEQAELAWSTHAIHAQAQQHQQQHHQPQDEEDEASVPEPVHSRALPRSNSDPDLNLSAHTEPSEFDSPKHKSSYSAHVSPYRYDQEPEYDDEEEEQNHYQPHPAAAAAHHDTSLHLSEQELLINQEIEDIERSLNEMSAFAAGRASRELTRRSQPDHSSVIHSPTHPQPFDGNRASSSYYPLDHALPTEWKRVISTQESALPIATHASSSVISPAASNQNRFNLPVSPARSFGGNRLPSPNVASTPSSSASIDPASGVMRLTVQFDQLAQEVQAFMNAKA